MIVWKYTSIILLLMEINSKKQLKIYKYPQMLLSNDCILSNEKLFMLMNKGIVLGHHISSCVIEVGPIRVTIINQLPTPHKQKGSEVSLAM